MEDPEPLQLLTERLFKIEDLDGDGIVTVEEFDTPKYLDEIEEELRHYEKTKQDLSASMLFKDDEYVYKDLDQ